MVLTFLCLASTFNKVAGGGQREVMGCLFGSSMAGTGLRCPETATVAVKAQQEP
jgi:hypothetical protein